MSQFDNSRRGEQHEKESRFKVGQRYELPAITHTKTKETKPSRGVFVGTEEVKGGIHYVFRTGKGKESDRLFPGDKLEGIHEEAADKTEGQISTKERLPEGKPVGWREMESNLKDEIFKMAEIPTSVRGRNKPPQVWEDIESVLDGRMPIEHLTDGGEMHLRARVQQIIIARGKAKLRRHLPPQVRNPRK